MAIWAIAGGVVTLTLDGSESGQVSKSHTFTAADGVMADELHTVYLTVNPDTASVNAFLEVEGGDTTVATLTGPHTLVARGVADGSANLTVHMGVQDVSSVAGVIFEEQFNYADIAAMLAAGWSVFENTFGAATASIAAVGGDSKSLRFDFGPAHVSSFWGVGKRYHRSVSLPAGTVTLQMRAQVDAVYHSGDINSIDARWSAAGVGGARVIAVTPGGFVLYEDSVTFAVPTTIDLRVGLDKWVTGDYDFTADIDYVKIVGAGEATVEFSGLQFCVGSGVGDGGTGLGEPEDPDDPESPPVDPIPDPPDDFEPWTGTRRMALWNCPVGGLDYFNSTVKIATRSNLVDLARIATAADSYLYLFMDSQSAWKDASGKWQFALWKAAFDRILDNALAAAALDDLIAAGLAAHFINDEPYTKGLRYGYGSGIPLAEIERCCQYSKSVLPDLPTMISLRPVPQQWWMTRHIDKLDWLACFYSENEGDCATFRDRNIARAIVLNHGLLLAPHYAHIEYPSSGSRYATPSQVIHYGTICATPPEDDPTYRIIGMLSWKYVAPMYAQAGFVEASHIVRNVLQSYD